MKKESFKPNLESTESVRLPNPNRKLAAQNMGLQAEGSASYSTTSCLRDHYVSHPLLTFFNF